VKQDDGSGSFAQPLSGNVVIMPLTGKARPFPASHAVRKHDKAGRPFRHKPLSIYQGPCQK